jgi:hypothetical protein
VGRLLRRDRAPSSNDRWRAEAPAIDQITPAGVMTKKLMKINRGVVAIGHEGWFSPSLQITRS